MEFLDIEAMDNTRKARAVEWFVHVLKRGDGNILKKH